MYQIFFIVFLIIFIIFSAIARNYLQRQQDERKERATWLNFAERHKLTFHPGNYFKTDVEVVGKYKNYPLKLFTSHYWQQIEGKRRRIARTHVHLFFYQPAILTDKHPPPPSQKLPNFTEKVFRNMLLPDGLVCQYKKKFQIMVEDGKIAYQHEGFESEKKYLGQVINMLCNMVDGMTDVLALGAETVPVLQKTANSEAHPLSFAARHLLRQIATQSQDLKAAHPRLLCSHCLKQYQTLNIGLPRRLDTTYYACPQCHQDKEYFEGEVEVILDSERKKERLETKNKLQVNWLLYDNIFDFDEIIIVQATDKDVERFAAQIGNDTDEWRRERYKEMTCTILEECILSQNTIRVLEEIVGSVVVKHV